MAKGGYRRSGLGWIAALVALGTSTSASTLLAGASLAAAALVAVLAFMPLTVRGRKPANQE